MFAKGELNMPFGMFSGERELQAEREMASLLVFRVKCKWPILEGATTGSRINDCDIQDIFPRAEPERFALGLSVITLGIVLVGYVFV